MRAQLCICGCGRKRGIQLHHVVYKQELRRLVTAEHAAARRMGPPDIVREIALVSDHRNLVPIGPKCHAAHHNRSRPLALTMLPDSVFEFASEVLGAPKAFNYLERRYAGGDPRLDALLAVSGGQEAA